jgi:hypothetical protein
MSNEGDNLSHQNSIQKRDRNIKSGQKVQKKDLLSLLKPSDFNNTVAFPGHNRVLPVSTKNQQ